MLSRLFKTLSKKTDPTPRQPSVLDLTTSDAVANFADKATGALAGQDACPLVNGGILLINPDDVKAAFSQKGFSNEPSRFSALAPRNCEKYVAAQVATNIPPFLDALRHATVRKWLSKCVLTTLSDLRDGIDARAHDYVSELHNGEPVLLVETVGRSFATSTICAFAGLTILPKDLKRYTAGLFKLFAPIHDAKTFEATNIALADARAALLDQLSSTPADTAPSLLKSMRAWDHLLDELNLTPDARDILIADNILLVLADGIENVEAAIGTVMVAWCAIVQDQRPEMTEDFVRSCIRGATPGQTIARIATRDLHIGKMACPAGSPVFLSLAGANARATDGTDFSFGMGRHRCIGEGLAIEMIVACCRHLAARSPITDVRELSFEPVFGHRWMRGVTITPT